MISALNATAEQCACIQYMKSVYTCFREKAFRSNQKPCMSLFFLQRTIYLGGPATFGKTAAGIPYCLQCTKTKITLNLRYYLCITNQRFGGQINLSFSSIFLLFHFSVCQLDTKPHVCLQVCIFICCHCFIMQHNGNSAG